MAETLVPEGQVHELLRVRREPPAIAGPRSAGLNISILNAVGRRWVDIEDLMRWFDSGIRHTGSEVMATARRELAEVTGATT